MIISSRCTTTKCHSDGNNITFIACSNVQDGLCNSNAILENPERPQGEGESVLSPTA